MIIILRRFRPTRRRIVSPTNDFQNRKTHQPTKRPAHRRIGIR
jgi:hypothetical protein